MPENVGYVTELIASYSYTGLSHTALGPTGVSLCMSCSLLDLWRNVFLSTLVVCHGDLLTVVIVHHFGLWCIREAHKCVNGSPANRSLP